MQAWPSMLPVVTLSFAATSAMVNPAKVADWLTPVPAPASSEWMVAPLYPSAPSDPVQGIVLTPGTNPQIVRAVAVMEVDHRAPGRGRSTAIHEERVHATVAAVGADQEVRAAAPVEDVGSAHHAQGIIPGPAMQENIGHVGGHGDPIRVGPDELLPQRRDRAGVGLPPPRRRRSWPWCWSLKRQAARTATPQCRGLVRSRPSQPAPPPRVRAKLAAEAAPPAYDAPSRYRLRSRAGAPPQASLRKSRET